MHQREVPKEPCCKLCRHQTQERCWRRSLLDYLKSEDGQYVLCFIKEEMDESRSRGPSILDTMVTDSTDRDPVLFTQPAFRTEPRMSEVPDHGFRHFSTYERNPSLHASKANANSMMES